MIINRIIWIYIDVGAYCMILQYCIILNRIINKIIIKKKKINYINLDCGKICLLRRRKLQ